MSKILITATNELVSPAPNYLAEQGWTVEQFAENNYAEGTYSIVADDYDNRTVDEAKLDLCQQVKDKQEELINTETVTYNGNNFTITKETQTNLTGIASQKSLFNDTSDVIFGDADDEDITLTDTEFKAMATLIFNRVNAIWRTRATKLTEVKAMTTLAEVDAYDINAGW